MTIERYMALPWTIEVEERADDGHYWVAYIRELKGFVATGRTPEELDRDLWDGLAEFLRSFLEAGDRIPIPAGSEHLIAAGEPQPVLQVSDERVFAGSPAPILQTVS